MAGENRGKGKVLNGLYRALTKGFTKIVSDSHGKENQSSHSLYCLEIGEGRKEKAWRERPEEDRIPEENENRMQPDCFASRVYVSNNQHIHSSRHSRYCRGTDCPRSLGVWEWPACSLVPVAACWDRLLLLSLVLHREAFTVRTSLSEVTEDFTGEESTVRG